MTVTVTRLVQNYGIDRDRILPVLINAQYQMQIPNMNYSLGVQAPKENPFVCGSSVTLGRLSCTYIHRIILSSDLESCVCISGLTTHSYSIPACQNAL